MLIISAFSLLLINMLIFWMYDYNRRRSAEFTELQLQLQKEYDTAEHYKMQLEQDENQKILIHDIRKHLQSIKTLNDQGDPEKIDAYIDQIISSSQLQTPVHVCDNPLLDAILSRYIRSCAAQDITLRADIHSKSVDFMAEEDMTALFCNLLDNAAEAAAGLPDACIELSVVHREEASLSILTMINSCRTNPISPETGKPFSRKGNSSRHGYGLKSVQRIIQKYGGEMQLYYDEDDNSFHTIITLQESNENIKRNSK